MAYEKLKEATPEELLEALIHLYTKYATDPASTECMLRLGFALAQEDGWRHVAPAWLEEMEIV